MLTRRRVLSAGGCALLPLRAPAQAPGLAPALQAAVAAYVDAWNRRDIAALSPLLSDEVEWVSIYTSGVKRGRQSFIDYAAIAVAVYGVDLRVSRFKGADDEAIAVLSGRLNEYPFRDGKYTRVWERDVLFTRWRRDGGHWRLAFLNENATQSAQLAKAAGL